MIGLSWAALIIGVVGGIAADNASPTSVQAALPASIWVLALSTIPRSAIVNTLVIDSVSLSGAILTLLPLIMTGGSNSPYIVLAMMPTIVASSLRGFRMGLAVGLLTAALMATIEITGSAGVDSLNYSTISRSALFVILAIAVAYTRTLWLDARANLDRLSRSSHTAEKRLDELETANQLLLKLSALSAEPGSGPVAVGNAALEDLLTVYPDASISAVLRGEQGPIVVARRGITPRTPVPHRIPLIAGGRNVGEVSILTDHPLSEEEISGLRTRMQPLALVFANVLLLQSIAGSAAKEERSRLARELHDEIGPSLASLGLAIDVALVRGVEQHDLADHLQSLRERVSDMVEEVRTTVTDLRTPRQGSLKEYLSKLLTELGKSDSDVRINVDERRPVRPSLADSVYGVVGEALRNALWHSGATEIQLRGWIDFEKGRLVLTDNGSGFDIEDSNPGHYGLIGMKERADAGGLNLQISSSQVGTRVVVDWGNS